MNHLILQYFYLQALDFLTTLAFLLSGVREGNPVVRLFLCFGSTPLGGLMVVKVFAVALGVFCWRMGRHRLLGRMNLFFAALIVWNLVALILGRFGV
jgi:hypothetical protein